MNKKQNELILEQFKDNFDFKNNNNNIYISFNRVAFIFFIFAFFFLIFSLKLILLSKTDFINKQGASSISDFRSKIIDRNGNILAKSLITKNIGINPKEVIDINKLIINLKIIFPSKDFDEIRDKISKNKFFYLEKQISSEKYQQLMLLGDKSIKEDPKITRVYPQKNLFSHLIGQIDDDNNGISGIEKYFDFELKNSKKDLKLSLDANLQYLIRDELTKSKLIFNSLGSAAILMNIDNGEILSMISLPDYDLNKRQNINDPKFINRASKAVYELGSVFKTFTYAAGLNESIIEPDTKFNNLDEKIKCGGFTIKEYDEKIPKNLTAEEILIRSGNIGSVRIGQQLGIDKYKRFLESLDITKKINFDIEEVGTPLPFEWGKCKLVTSSFGHGITTTALQLSKAYAILSNGGYKIRPTIIKNKSLDKHNFNRILNDGISEKVNAVLRKIVSSKEGTAGFADIKGFEIGGKTGTAQKTIDGKYSSSKVNTFVSVFPTSKPKFVFLVLLDEPKVNKEYIYNYRDGSGFKYKGNWRNTAGWTSVEVAGKIIEKIGPILATKY